MLHAFLLLFPTLPVSLLIRSIDSSIIEIESKNVAELTFFCFPSLFYFFPTLSSFCRHSTFFAWYCFLLMFPVICPCDLSGLLSLFYGAVLSSSSFIYAQETTATYVKTHIHRLSSLVFTCRLFHDCPPFSARLTAFRCSPQCSVLHTPLATGMLCIDASFHSLMLRIKI